MSRDGSLVDANGNLLSPQITLPANAQGITIATDGTVRLQLAGPDRGADRRTDPTGRFHQSRRFEQSGSESLSADFCLRRSGPGDPGGQEGMGTLLQGYTEQSNVSVVDEFVNLIVSQRAYEANSKVVKARRVKCIK